MIRRSTGFAAGALILSLALHFVAIGLTFSPRADRPSSDGPVETVSLGTSFEEIADLTVAPVEPEPIQAVEPPEPEEQTPPDPQEAEVPTTEALVASSNPQETFAPDTGITPSVSEATELAVTPETSETPLADTPAPVDGTESGSDDFVGTTVAGTEPETATPPPAPVETPAGAAPADTTIAQSPNAESTITTAPNAPQVTPPVAAVIAALPPETRLPILEGVAPITGREEQENDVEEQGGPVTTSLRPPSINRDPEAQEQSGFGRADTRENVQSPPLIESPLARYARDGVQVFGGQQSQRRSRSSGAGGGRGPGNSDVTNYAGRVLVHLNRTPPVAVSARGWARVSFRINPDGSLASVDVIDGSGSSEVNLAAKTQVRSGVPFPRPPGGESRLLSFVYRP